MWRPHAPWLPATHAAQRRRRGGRVSIFLEKLVAGKSREQLAQGCSSRSFLASTALLALGPTRSAALSSAQAVAKRQRCLAFSAMQTPAETTARGLARSRPRSVASGAAQAKRRRRPRATRHGPPSADPLAVPSGPREAQTSSSISPGGCQGRHSAGAPRGAGITCCRGHSETFRSKATKKPPVFRGCGMRRRHRQSWWRCAGGHIVAR